MQAQVATPGADPVTRKITDLERTGQWPELADYCETLDANQRGEHLESWVRAMVKAERWERLIHICDLVLPQLKGKAGREMSLLQVQSARARALSGLGRHAESMAAYEESAVSRKGLGLYNACVEARLVPDWPGLQRCAEAILATDPRGIGPWSATALGWKGEALARQEKFDDAEPVLRQALELDPKQAMPWSNLGRCLNEKKAWGQAKEALDRAVELDPTLMEAHYNRGRCHFELKRYAESVQDFKAALALNPNDPVLQENLHQAERYLHPRAVPSSKSQKSR